MTLEQIKAARLTRDYDGRYGKNPQWTPAMFVEAIYRTPESQDVDGVHACARLLSCCRVAIAALAQRCRCSRQRPPGAAGRGRGGPRRPAGRRPTAARRRRSTSRGYWVSLVTDDWRYRMLTPPKGNADYMPVNAEARRVMDEWDPAKDEAGGEACRGYGAGGVMRLPGRLHITWENDNTLKMDIDAGTQTRRFVFGAAPRRAAEPSWQGSPRRRAGCFPGRRGRGAERPPRSARRDDDAPASGLPAEERHPLQRQRTYHRVLRAPRRDEAQEYLAVTTMVDDPQYLALPYIKTYEYKKQPDASGLESHRPVPRSSWNSATRPPAR